MPEDYYTFLGLERTGGIVVFDSTQPEKARLVGYFNNANADGRPAGPVARLQCRKPVCPGFRDLDARPYKRFGNRFTSAQFDVAWSPPLQVGAAMFSPDCRPMARLRHGLSAVRSNIHYR